MREKHWPYEKWMYNCAIEFLSKSSIVIPVWNRDTWDHTLEISFQDRKYPHISTKGRVYFQNFNVITGIPFIEFRICLRRCSRSAISRSGNVKLYRDRTNNRSHRITRTVESRQRSVNKCAPKVTADISRIRDSAGAPEETGSRELTEACNHFSRLTFLPRRGGRALVGAPLSACIEVNVRRRGEEARHAAILNSIIARMRARTHARIRASQLRRREARNGARTHTSRLRCPDMSHLPSAFSRLLARMLSIVYKKKKKSYLDYAKLFRGKENRD